MNEENDLQSNEPTQNSKNIWIIAISVIITALVVGGGVYAWQRFNLKSAEQNLQQQIENLQSQLNQLQQGKANQNVNQTNSLESEQIKETTEHPEDATKLVGYYIKYLDKAWGEEKYCTSITVTGGDQELINSFIELINSGNTVYDKNEINQPIVNLDISVLSELEKQKFLNSTKDNQVELTVLKENDNGHGAPICYSTLVILGIK